MTSHEDGGGEDGTEKVEGQRVERSGVHPVGAVSSPQVGGAWGDDGVQEAGGWESPGTPLRKRAIRAPVLPEEGREGRRAWSGGGCLPGVC